MAGLDDTEQEQESVGNHLGKMRERLAGRTVEEETDEVSTDAPEPEEDDEEEAEVAPSRKDKRASRQTARERAAAAEAEAKVLREMVERIGQPPARQAQQVPDTADVDSRIRAANAEYRKLEDDYLAAQNNKTLTPEMAKRMQDRAEEIEIQKMELAAERREIRTAPTRRQKDLSDQLARDNADVYGHPQALQYAAGRVNQLIAMGEKDSKELHDRVMAETRQVVLKVKPKPEAIDRQRSAGMSPGPRIAAPTTSATIKMPKGSQYYKMAQAWAQSKNLDLSPEQACQKWAQTVGKNLVRSG